MKLNLFFTSFILLFLTYQNVFGFSTTRNDYKNFRTGGEYVPEGTAGYVLTKPGLFSMLSAGEFKETVIGPHQYSPIHFKFYEIIPVDIRKNTYTESFEDIMVKDRLTVDFNAHFQLRIRISNDGTDNLNTLEDRVTYIVEKQGGNKWYETNVKEPLRNIVRQEVERYGAFEVNPSRGTIVDSIKERIDNFLEKSPYECLQVDIGKFDLPDKIKHQIEETMRVEQEKETIAAQLEVEKDKRQVTEMQGQNKVIKAQKEADALKILNEALSAEILKKEEIDALKELAASANSKIVFMPGSILGSTGNLPLVMDPVNVLEQISRAEQNQK
ncbi:MAG: hypothetical protein H6622_05125 [Halobacteriovoraceae bacterium]|nr:hypothetical protein [Halobacteriovoraceae bacterium]